MTHHYNGKKKCTVNLSLGGKVEYIPNFLNSQEKQDLFDHLKNEMKWVSQVYKMYGKDVPTPRLLSSMMDPKFKVDSVGSIWKPDTEWVKAGKDWTPLMLKLKNKIEKKIGKPISYAQLNQYRTGNDYIGYHTDSEVQKGDLVASISLGSTRRFVLRDKSKKSGPPEYEFLLTDGSLLIFDCDAAKTFWKHSLPKVRKMDGYTDPQNKGRINVTFRN